MHHLLQFEFWLSLLTLTLLEIILNIDNIIFIVAASSRLPQKKQALSRKVGLIGAAMMRILLLTTLFFAMSWTQPLFYFCTFPVALNNIILVLGGVFLVINPALELRASHNVSEGKKNYRSSVKFSLVILQIMFIDLVLSIDNVVTAIGVAKVYLAMVAAIIIAMIFMVIASSFLSHVVEKYPKLKTIGLSYLILVGLALVARGFNYEVPSMYLYLPLGFVIFSQLMLIYTRTD